MSNAASRGGGQGVCLIPGVVSITFRALGWRKVIAITRQGGLRAIEWGGDIHAPHGNIPRAREIRRAMAEAGVTTVSYGSYWHAGNCRDGDPSFHAVLDTALELGAPVIRIWAGRCSSSQATTDDWDRVIDDARTAAALAQDAGLRVVFEYHGGTLTDTPASAVKLMQRMDDANCGICWQPAPGKPAEAGVEEITALQPWFTTLHVFAWGRDTSDRLPLRHHQERWQQWFLTAARAGRPIHALLEFVRNDDPEAFLDDAAILLEMLSQTEHALPKEPLL